MNKAQLIQVIASKVDAPKTHIDAVLTATLEAIMDTVSQGGKVTLVGFGSFESRDRSARQGRNPQTGEIIEIPASRAPAFSAGKLFKEKVS